jgi:glucose-6-phosphate 1-dehydrogenase
VDHVQMTVAETLGVEQRGAYYDHAGALRDIVQNHMLQLLTLVAMEPPSSFSAEDVRDEKAKDAAIAGRAQRSGRSRADGARAVRRLSPGTEGHPDSRTETTLRCGSRSITGDGLACRSTCAPARSCRRQLTEIVVQFKRAPFTLFRHTPVRSLNPNAIILRIQPDEGISLSFDAKVPGPFSTTRDRDDGFWLQGVLQGGAEHRLRDAALRRVCTAIRPSSIAWTSSKPAGRR